MTTSSFINYVYITAIRPLTYLALFFHSFMFYFWLCLLFSSYICHSQRIYIMLKLLNISTYMSSAGLGSLQSTYNSSTINIASAAYVQSFYHKHTWQHSIAQVGGCTIYRQIVQRFITWQMSIVMFQDFLLCISNLIFNFRIRNFHGVVVSHICCIYDFCSLKPLIFF